MKQKSSFQRILEISGARKKEIYISVILSAASAMIALVPYCEIWKVIHGILFEESGTEMRTYGWAAFLWVAVSAVLYLIALFFSYRAAAVVSRNNQEKLIRHIAALPYNMASSLGTGKMRKTITETSETLENYVSHQFPGRVITVATPVGVLILLFAFDWKLGLLSIISLIIGIILLVTFMGKGLVKVMKEYQDSLDQMSNDVAEYVRDISVVKLFGQSIFSFRKLKSSIDNYEHFVIAYIKRLELPMAAYSVAIYSTFVFLTIGGIYIGTAGMSMEQLSNYIFYVIFTPAIVLMMNRFMYQSKSNIRVKDAFERIDRIMNMESETESTEPKIPVSNDIELKNVSFSYDGNQDAVKNVSLTLKEGETAVFVGNSGGGKTTVANLISGLYQTERGEIRIGGVKMQDIPKKTLNRLVSTVYQDSRLIKGTLLDNIRMANPNATEEDVLRALEASQCMDILEKFPDGMHTVIGTKGVYLSGGEAQRLAIARCYLKDSPIVILDEATAYADPDNERKIQAALTVLMQKKTVIMIAHRLSVVKGLGKVYVFSDGEIAESGTQEELMNKKGHYFRMWQQYEKASEWKIEESQEKEVRS